jgi:hypothetical protein
MEDEESDAAMDIILVLSKFCKSSTDRMLGASLHWDPEHLVHRA